MSFILEQKNEIIRQQYKSACCRRAILYGALFARGSVEDNSYVSISLENDEIASFLSSIVLEIFNTNPTVTTKKGGGRGRTLTYKSASSVKYLESIEKTDSYLIEKCNSCRGSFFKGIFLASGKMSDPTKQYRLEFSLTGRAMQLHSILYEADICFSYTIRGGKELLYTNNSNVIEDFLAASGLNGIAFILMNEKISGELKNNVNRVTNCETQNIDKSVRASKKHREAIEFLINSNLLSSLPEELVHTAQMRMQYSEYSLTRLAATFSPPLTKSGLSHRLNKIVQIAEELSAK